jgi:cysteine desulfurase/selenocysteine lyase
MFPTAGGTGFAHRERAEEEIGTAPGKTAILSFNVGERKPEDVIKALDAKGIAVAGPELAAQPLMTAMGEEAGAARALFSFYNTRANALANAVAGG